LSQRTKTCSRGYLPILPARWFRRRRRDLAESQHVFNSVIEEWAQAQPGNQELLALAREEIANDRKGE
jgi:hypothetical protein